MPVCVHCAYPAKHLYTTYSSESNIRLGVCPRCKQFLDPLIEHPATILLLDLVLLKPRVYLHLLFNRGAIPEKAGKDQGPAETQGKHALWWDLVRLAVLYVAAETCVRQMTQYDGLSVLDDVLLVVTELAAQHAMTLLVASCSLWYHGWLRFSYTKRVKKDAGTANDFKDGRKDNFSLLLVNLTLLFTSVLPLLLHLIISIWSTAEEPSQAYQPSISSILPSVMLACIPSSVEQQLQQVLNTGADKIWVMTRLLGGMSCGFGLRVLLPTNPLETTLIVLSGWAAAAGTGKILTAWLSSS